MLDTIRVLQALSISVAVAAAIVMLLGWPWRAPNRVRARIGGVLGGGGGIYVGCWWLGVSPNWPPREDQDRLLFVLFPALIVVEAVVAFAARPRWLPWLLRMAVAASAAPILLYGSSYISEPAGPGSREWTLVQTGLILGGLATMLAAVWGALGLLVKRSDCRSVPVVLAIVCAGASVTVMLSGYASGGQIGLTISAALLGAVIASLVWAGTPEMDSVVSLGVVGLFALLVVGRFFGQLSTANAAVLFGAPLLAWGAELPFVRRGGWVVHSVARVILPAIAVAVALLLARQQFLADAARTARSNDPSADDYMKFEK
jgi:hypothetical protein